MWTFVFEMSRHQRIFLFCGLFVLVILIITLLGHRSSALRRLEAYKRELRSHGEKLSYSSLKGSNSFQLKSSYLAFTNAAGKLRNASMNTAWLDLRKYVGPGRARALCLDASPGRPWDELSAELVKIDDPLAEIREAMKDPPPDWHVGTNMVTGLPNFIAMRLAAQWLSLAALRDLHNGQLEPALADIEGLVGLVRMNRDEYTLAAQMIRVAVAGLALATTWEALQVAGWTGPQLQRLQAAWQEVDLTDALEKGMLGERAMGEELWDRLRQNNGLRNTSALLARPLLGSSSATNSVQNLISEYVLFPFYKMTSMDNDELFYLQTMQECLVAVRSLNASGPWASTHDRLDKVFMHFNQLTGSAQRFRYPFSSIAIPNFIKALEHGVRAEAERQLAIAAIALKRFQVAHGEWPLTLETLVGDYLPAASHDPITGKALHYRRQPGGDPILYSVGLDGQDNGGDARPSTGTGNGLWEGRDAVWPLLAPLDQAR